MGLLNYNPYGESSGSQGITDTYGTPSGTTDIGKFGGLLGSKSGVGQIGSIADKFAGTGGWIGNSVDAAAQYGKTGKVSSMMPAGARQAIGLLGSYSGAPLGLGLGLAGKTSKGVNRGMTPVDASMGAILDSMMDMGFAGLGGSIFGPLGALGGGLLGGLVDVSGMARGLSQGLSDWGNEAQRTANLATREGMQKTGVGGLLGFDDIDNFQDVQNMMDFLGTPDVDRAHNLTKAGEGGFSPQGPGTYGGGPGADLGAEPGGGGGFNDGGDSGVGGGGGFGDRGSEPGGMGGV